MTPEQWEAVLTHLRRFHHPEVFIVGLPALAVLAFLAWQLWRIAEALHK